MSTALALWTPPALVSRRRIVDPTMLFALDSPRTRLHFAFLASIKRVMVQAGRLPDEIEPSMHKGHVEWWQRCSRSVLGTHVPMHEASLEEVQAVVVPVAAGVDTSSHVLRWYPDGWHPLVTWAAAGARGDTRQASGMRVVESHATPSERTRHMSAEDRLDAEDLARPALRVVQLEKPPPAGPLFEQDLPPLSNDLEAELYGDEPEPWEGY